MNASADKAPTAPDAFTRHRGPVTSVAAIAGTEAVLSAAYDGAVARFDFASGAVQLLGYHRHLANRIVIDSAGRRAASCSSDYCIRLWDVPAGRAVRELRGHYDDVEDFLFIDEDIGVSASRDRQIMVWDLNTGAIRRILEGHDRDVLALACHDGRLFSSGDDMTLRVWDLDSGRQQYMIGPFDNETDTCAVDPDHGQVILGCDDGCIRAFSLDDGRPIGTVQAHRSGIKKVAVSAASGRLLSAAYDRRIVIWDCATLEQIGVVDSTASVWERSLDWSRDGRHVIAGTFDGTVLRFDAASGELDAELGLPPEDEMAAHRITGEQTASPGNACFNDLAVADDGRVVAVSDDGIVRLSRFNDGPSQWRQTIPGEDRVLMNAVTMDRSGRRILAGAHDGRLHGLLVTGDDDPPGGPQAFEARWSRALNEGPINAVATLPDGPSSDDMDFALVACYSGAMVGLRVDDDGSEVRFVHRHHEGAVKSLAPHPDGQRGASCGADGLLLVWNLQGDLLAELPGHTAIINDMDISPCGRRLASVSRDFCLNIYDLDSYRMVRRVPLGRRSLKSVRFLSDTTVAVGDYWGGVMLVDSGSGRVTGRRQVAENGISALARVHGPAGLRLAAASYDGSIRLLDGQSLDTRIRLQAMRQRLCPVAADSEVRPEPSSRSQPAAASRTSAEHESMESESVA